MVASNTNRAMRDLLHLQVNVFSLFWEKMLQGKILTCILCSVKWKPLLKWEKVYLSGKKLLVGLSLKKMLKKVVSVGQSLTWLHYLFTHYLSFALSCIAVLLF